MSKPEPTAVEKYRVDPQNGCIWVDTGSETIELEPDQVAELLNDSTTQLTAAQAEVELVQETLTEVLTEHRLFFESVERYVKAHRGIRTRFQNAELADEYTEAGKSVEAYLNPARQAEADQPKTEGGGGG